METVKTKHKWEETSEGWNLVELTDYEGLDGMPSQDASVIAGIKLFEKSGASLGWVMLPAGRNDLRYRMAVDAAKADVINYLTWKGITLNMIQNEEATQAV